METIGWLASVLTTFSFVPQAIKVIRTKDTSSISLWMYSLFTVGILFWLVYGVMMRNGPMTFANVTTLVLAVIILRAKIKNG